MQSFYDVFAAMGVSPFTFYLTGSRFHGKVRRDSDWDFFVGDKTPDLHWWLLDNGFKEMNNSRYHDSATCCVYRHLLGIDIQVIRPELLEKKIWARDKLKAMGIWSSRADLMRSIWTAMIQSDGTLVALESPQAIQVMVAANHPALFCVN